MGNVYQMGHFDECLEANAPFATQYCFVTIKAKPSTNRSVESYSNNYSSVVERFYEHRDPSREQKNFVKVAWCVPASCSPNDLEESLDLYLKATGGATLVEDVEFSATVAAEECQVNESPTLDQTDWCFW